MNLSNSRNQTKRRCRLRIYFLGILLINSLSLWSQTSNSDFERIKLFSPGVEYSGIALSPDKNTIAISAKKLEPVKIVDWKNQKIIQEINAGNWTYGSKISYSESGKYLLLQELNYMDFSQNKKRNIGFEIIDAANGKSVKRYENVQDVIVSSDEKYAVSLSNDEVTCWNLAGGSIEKSITVPGAANAIALSSDGKTLAVSVIINHNDLKDRFKKDKKSLNNAVKFKQMVSLYDMESKSRIKTVSELYDLIYNLSFLPEGNFLSVYQTPEIRIQVNNNKQSFINLIDMSTQEPIRKGFTSMSIAQPELKFSSDNKLLAINSKGSRFQEIHLYDSETGTLQKRFELASRLFEKSDGEKLQSDPRPTFVFLPGDQEILIAIGNQLIKWNLESNP